MRSGRKASPQIQLNSRFPALAALVPDAMAKIQSRVGALHQKTAPTELVEAMSIWSKAQAAFAAGNMAESVSSAKAAESKTRAAAVQLKVEFPPGLGPGPGPGPAPVP
jgi:hypothetical protein